MLFPCHLYKVPGPHQRLGYRYKYVGCRDEKHFAELTAQGWCASIEEAAGETVPVEEAQMTDREVLERKATELGVKFDGRTTDKKLAERIEEVLG